MYDEQVHEVERGSYNFSFSVFSYCGGMGQAAVVVDK